MIYLDNNATTRPTQAVVDAMTRALEESWQNPSSLHRAGQTVRREVDRARASVANLIGARAPEIVFTGSGTESLDLAVRGTLATTDRRKVISSPIEHAALRALLRKLEADGRIDLVWTPMKQGVVDVEATSALIDDSVALVTIQWANNETGSIQPVETLAAICRERAITFHTDATQWVGKMPTNVGTAPDQHDRPAGITADLLTFAGHKFHAPKGIGILWIRRGARIRPVIHGAQELGRRGGTENTTAIIGLGVAAEQARAWLADPRNIEAAAARRDHFEQALIAAVPTACINARSAPLGRVWSASNVAFADLEAEPLLLALSERGVCASAGSACSSGSIDPSPVLRAAGVDPRLAASSIRFSFCRETPLADLDEAIRIIAECARSLREALPKAS